MRKVEGRRNITALGSNIDRIRATVALDRAGCKLALAASLSKAAFQKRELRTQSQPADLRHTQNGIP